MLLVLISIVNLKMYIAWVAVGWKLGAGRLFQTAINPKPHTLHENTSRGTACSPDTTPAYLQPNFQTSATHGTYNFRFTILIDTNNTTNNQSTTLQNNSPHTNEHYDYHTQRNTTIATHNVTLRLPHIQEHYDYHTQRNTTITTHKGTL